MPDAIACTVCGDPLRTNEIEDRVCKYCGQDDEPETAATWAIKTRYRRPGSPWYFRGENMTMSLKPDEDTFRWTKEEAEERAAKLRASFLENDFEAVDLAALTEAEGREG